MNATIIVHPKVAHDRAQLRALAADINKWLSIEVRMDQAIESVSTQCSFQIEQLRRALITQAGRSALKGEALLASLLTDATESAAAAEIPTIKLGAVDLKNNRDLYRSIALMCAPDRNQGLDQDAQSRLTGILTQASEAQERGDTRTLQLLSYKAELVRSGQDLENQSSESSDSIQKRIASLSALLEQLQDSIRSKTSFGVVVFNFLKPSDQSFDTAGLKEKISTIIEQWLQSHRSQSSEESPTESSIHKSEPTSLSFSRPTSTEHYSSSLVHLSIDQQITTLSEELTQIAKKVSLWAQFILHSYTSCSELILRDASGTTNQGFRFSWVPPGLSVERPNDLPTDFSLFMIERESSGVSAAVREAVRAVIKEETLGGADADTLQEHHGLPTDITFWMNAQGLVRLQEADKAQSSLAGMRLFTNSVHDLLSFPEPLVTCVRGPLGDGLWVFSGKTYRRNQIPIRVAAFTNISEVNDLDKALISIARALCLLKTPVITERRITQEIWAKDISGDPDDFSTYQFYSSDSSLEVGQIVELPPKNPEDQEKRLGQLYISSDETKTDHFAPLLSCKDVTFSGSITVSGKLVSCRCTLKGIPLYEYLSKKPALNSSYSVHQWEISFGDITMSSKEINDVASETVVPILQALADVIPYGFNTSKITFRDRQGKIKEYFPGVLAQAD